MPIVMLLAGLRPADALSVPAVIVIGEETVATEVLLLVKVTERGPLTRFWAKKLPLAKYPV
jgi:hypothetical protein